MNATDPCDHFEPLLSAYLLEEASEAERTEVEAHLASCERCREEMALLSSTAALVRKSAPAEVAFRPIERQKILQAARVGASPSRRSVVYWIGGLAAAAMLVVGVTVLFQPAGLAPNHVETPPPLEVVDVFAAPSPAKPAGGDAVNKTQDASKDVKALEELTDLVTAGSTRAPEEKQVELVMADAAAQKQEQQEVGFVGAGKVAPTEVVVFAKKSFRSFGLGEGKAAPAQEAAELTAARSRGGSPVAGREGSFTYKATESLRAPDPLQPVTLERSFDGQDRAEKEKLALSFSESKMPAPAKKRSVEQLLQESKPADKAQMSLEEAKKSPVNVVTKEPAAPAPRPTAANPGVPAALPPVVASLAPAPDWKARVDEFLSRLDRKPGETPDTMFFRYWGDNPFVETSVDPLSTFGVDVDTASYTILRSYLYKQSVLPPREAVRTEEFINYFKSHYAPPTEEGKAFAIHAEIAPSPFAHEPGYQLLKVGLKGREVARDKRKACSLVFVVDTSGSMRRENRLELVKDALRLLVKELDEGDTIGIVAFDSEARTILEAAPASEKERILDAISSLEPRHNTNVAAGLQMGYQMAGAHILKDGSNRVILLSDGVANTGITDPNVMLEQIRKERERGVYLTCVGVGMGNLNDTLLEQLADRGNGHCVYVDRLEEARKVFVENLTGTLETIAKDVKIQVEFDPAKVIRYRLLGYENRAIADAAFRDNTVDAGEVGAGHEVTALYELKARPEGEGKTAEAESKLATIRVRYLTVDHGEAVEFARPVTSRDSKGAFADVSPHFQLTACVAELAEVLRDSYWARGSSLDRVASMVETLLPKLDGDQDAVELVALLKKADALVRQRDAAADEVSRTVDAIKDNHYLQSRIEYELERRRETNHSQLEEIIRRNNELRSRLEEILRKG